MTKAQKKKILVITGTRAEYGLLTVILRKIRESNKLELKLMATGTHLSPAFGNTYLEIEKDGFNIDFKIDILIASDKPAAVAKSIGLAVTSFTQVYQELQPDVILFLGDRYELLAAAAAALPFNIALAHIAGGEITEGAMDDQIRHALTKMSHIHFACSGHYADNIRRLCEEKWRIHNVGHPCLELINEINLIPKAKLFKKYNLDLSKKLFLVTLHSTTLNSIATERKQAKAFFNVIKKNNDVNIIITYPNSDTNGQVILKEINELKDFENIKIVPNLGSINYLSIIKICDIAIGNSSSGLVEGPFFKVPVINYGDRQKGRLKAPNIIDCKATEAALQRAIHKALNDTDYIINLKFTKSHYGVGTTSDKIVKVLEDVIIDEMLLRKKFAI